jgi:hypothetical protein
LFALLIVVGGMTMFFWDQRAAVGMEAVGWLAVWITGTLAERYPRR